ncbi:MAG: SMP-30/gluconolactonase/LRE family protein [Actinobacteria bacterium]|nr:SMP-30/gluconolactonase/LRE family protein [Actinomycetota bacterium]
MQKVLDGLWFGEGPRWHHERLWFSDMHGHRVLSTDLAGDVRTEVEMIDDEPSGLGWLPDGRLLVVAMESQQLRRVEHDGRLALHADLSAIARGSLNDMIVASDGTAYIGDMGSRIHDGGERQPGQTIAVRSDGSWFVAADQLESPNGHVLTADEAVLLVAESAAARVTAFDRRPDGTLANRRVYAALHPSPDGPPFAPPDGICLDAEGAVWVADPIGARVFRVLPGRRVDPGCVCFGWPRPTNALCLRGRRLEARRSPQSANRCDLGYRHRDQWSRTALTNGPCGRSPAH